MAGSSVTFSPQEPLLPGQIVRRTAVAWVSDDSAGTASGTSTESFYGLLYGITTDPSATAPTDNYDVTISSAVSATMLGTNGNDRDTSTTEFASADPYPIPVYGPITVAIANAGNSKEGTIYLWTEAR